jgi:hypothetical protein
LADNKTTGKPGGREKGSECLKTALIFSGYSIWKHPEYLLLLDILIFS